MRSPTELTTPHLREAFHEYLDYARRYRGLAEQTISAYGRDGDKFLQWAVDGGLPEDLAEISRQHVQAYLNSLAGLSPATIRRAAYSLSGLFSHLQREGRIAANPAASLVLPKRRRRLPKVPNIEQAERLMAAAFDEREKAIIRVLLMGGLRRSELLGLDRKAVSPDCSELRILGKGDVERLIPLPPDAQIALARHVEKERIAQGPVFRNQCGHRLQQTSLQRIWQRLLRRAQLEDEGYTIHSCRAFYATALLRSGTDLGTLMQLMGHRSLESTTAYIGSDTTIKRKAIARFPLGRGSEGGDAR